MALFDLASLLIEETKEAIYAKGLEIATALGLPVTSWQAGDPTRSLYHAVSETLETLESIAVSFISSGFLDYAAARAETTGDSSWLKLLAKQTFNVDAIPATFASADDYVLTNTGGGVYDFDAGDITVKNPATDQTYTNTTGGHLGVGGTLVISIAADEEGSTGSAAANEITELVTTFLGVTGTNPTALVGQDEEQPSSIVQRCRDKLDAFSPNGARGAYAYVARNPDLTGTTNITRVRTFPESDTGDVTVYLATASGAPTTSDRDAVEAAIIAWCTPLTITPTVLSCATVSVPVTYTIWIYESVNLTTSEIEAAIATALGELFAARDIGGDIIPPATSGKLYTSLVSSAIRGVFDSKTFRVSLAAPAADVALANNEVAVLGTIIPTVNLIPDP